MTTDLLDIIKEIIPDETPLYVEMLVGQGLSRKEAWKKHKEMIKNAGYALDVEHSGDPLDCEVCDK